MKKETKIRIVLLLLLLLASNNMLKAQRNYFPYFNQYRFEGMVMNPAFAGSREVLSTSLFYRQLLAGFTGAPNYQTIAAHSPLKNYKIGLGFLFMHENIALDHTYDFFLNYAYRITMPIGKISLGLKGGFTINTMNNSEISISPRFPSDPVFENASPTETAFLPNVGIGFFYYTKNFFLGGSIPLMFTETANESGGGLTVTHDFDSYNYIGNTGLRIETPAGISFIPSVMVLYVKNSPAHYTANFSVEFLDERLSLGTGYRSGNAILGSVQFKANDQLKIGYTYDNTFGPGRIITPTHEIMLRYEFRYLIKASNPVDF